MRIYDPLRTALIWTTKATVTATVIVIAAAADVARVACGATFDKCVPLWSHMPRRQVISPQLSNALKAAATHYLYEREREWGDACVRDNTFMQCPWGCCISLCGQKLIAQMDELEHAQKNKNSSRTWTWLTCHEARRQNGSITTAAETKWDLGRWVYATVTAREPSPGNSSSSISCCIRVCVAQMGCTKVLSTARKSFA